MKANSAETGNKGSSKHKDVSLFPYQTLFKNDTAVYPD